MEEKKILRYLGNVLDNLPNSWLELTTHRLDIYNEELAKTQFLNELTELYNNNDSSSESLTNLPTAYDYIRLGHPLSCLLEWTISKLNTINYENILSFSSNIAPILAILRTNKLQNKKTSIYHIDELPENFDADIIKNIYGYSFDVIKVKSAEEIQPADGSSIFFSNENGFSRSINNIVDFYIKIIPNRGSIVVVNKSINQSYISEIQHVRRRETISMTPANCLNILKEIIAHPQNNLNFSLDEKNSVNDLIKKITGTHTEPLIGSSGLSVQYAIMMGLVQHAKENHNGKKIKFIVPTNCYGGTNDQARRVAASIDNVEVVDLHVDAGYDMVQSLNTVLESVAKEDAIPYIIAEIPTNPRVEVPDLLKLKEVLSETRKTAQGPDAIQPVFILDQTFCPNVQFLAKGSIFSNIRALAYVSGSKFPSGGKCTAGYIVCNSQVADLMILIKKHLIICDNEATADQVNILAEQLPSMLQRIEDAYRNTKLFVNFIQDKLPDAKINFVSEDLAKQGFTPSVFSLDLPAKGSNDEEREAYKRALNLKLINHMIKSFPEENKYCVSYGQLKGIYWTIPATSTQGTTKEGDKDYIARVSVSPKISMEKHMDAFNDFVAEI